MLIKVCGMRDANNMLDVAACGIQWMGFIFYPQSPRYFQETVIEVPDNICKVGVFVNADPAEMLSIYNRYKPLLPPSEYAAPPVFHLFSILFSIKKSQLFCWFKDFIYICIEFIHLLHRGGKKQHY